MISLKEKVLLQIQLNLEVLLQDFLTAKAMVIDLYNITVPRVDRFTYEQLRAVLRTACFGDYERGIY